MIPEIKYALTLRKQKLVRAMRSLFGCCDVLNDFHLRRAGTYMRSHLRNRHADCFAVRTPSLGQSTRCQADSSLHWLLTTESRACQCQLACLPSPSLDVSHTSPHSTQRRRRRRHFTGIRSSSYTTETTYATVYTSRLHPSLTTPRPNPPYLL